MSQLTISFFGVRGSTPCCAPELARFGGNTSCVVIEAEGTDPIILDVGTGLRMYGRGVQNITPFKANVLLSHLHWDHVQGLPFFWPVHEPDSSLSIFGPPEYSQSLSEAFNQLMTPPYFPIRCRDLNSHIEFTDVETDRFAVGDALVTSRSVPHIGPTNGYRIELGGYVVAYVPDHQQPQDETFVSDSVLELCDGADIVIHDSQYTERQFAKKSNWGHCSTAYATEVARQADADVLVMFHHDPDNDDVSLAELEDYTRRIGIDRGLTEVIAAAEGETIKLG